MKCYKCDMYTKVWRILTEDENKLPICLCGSCAVKFLEQLSNWKDFDLYGELKYWKTGVESDD